jgi:ATP-dependent helicase/nuclease subunit A
MMEQSFRMDESMIVVAGAGTGKTWRLVRRYLLAVAQSFPNVEAMQQVVAVTFTRAASAEMRKRVAELVQDLRDGALSADDPVASIDASRLPEPDAFAAALAAAPISTFHVLCSELLREFGEYIRVSPLLQVIETTAEKVEAMEFVSRKTDEWLDHPERNPGFRQLLDERDLSEVREILTTLICSPDILTEDRKTYLNGRNQVVEQTLAPFYATIRADLLELQSLASQASNAPNLKTEVLFACSRVMNPDADEPFSQMAIARNLVAKGLPTATHALVSDLRAAATALCQRRDTRIQLPKPDATGATPTFQSLTHNHHTTMQQWWDVAASMAGEFRDELKSRGRITYNELERLAGAVLRTIEQTPSLKAQLQGRFTHMLVDEFQDTNQLQVTILDQLRNICGTDTRRYYVGDAKQSIYRFRQADVSVFTRHMLDRPEADATVALPVADLPRSRRFSPQLADFFHVFFNRILPPTPVWPQALPEHGQDENAVAGRPFTPTPHPILDIDWHDHTSVLLNPPPHDPVSVVTARTEAALFLNDGQTPAPPAVSLLSSTEDNEQENVQGALQNIDGAIIDDSAPADDGSEEESGSDGQSSGEDAEDKPETAISIRARQKAVLWLKAQLGPNGQKVREKDGRIRDLKPSDIAILVPKWKTASAWAQDLQKADIPAQLGGGRGLLSEIPAIDFINLIRYFADPSDRTAALGVLRGPLFGLSDLGLYVLARWPGVQRLKDGEFVPWDEEPFTGPRKLPRSLHTIARSAQLLAEPAVDALIAAGALSSELRETRLRQLRDDAFRLEQGREALRNVYWRIGRESVAALLRELMVSQRMEAHWRILPNGDRHVANAWRFLAKIESQEGQYPDLQRLVAWLDSGDDPNPEGLMEALGNSITVTTFHSAKGLEWNIVVLAGLAEKPASQKGNWQYFSVRTASGNLQSIPLYKSKGPGFVQNDDPLKIIGIPDFLQCADEASETKRLLYVAMTRAREQVVFAGVVDFGLRRKSQIKKLSDAQHGELCGKLNVPVKPKSTLEEYTPQNPIPSPLLYSKSMSHYVAFALGLQPGTVPPAPVDGWWCANMPVVREDELPQPPIVNGHDVTEWERDTPPERPQTVWQGGITRKSVSPSRAADVRFGSPEFRVEFAPNAPSLTAPPGRSAALPSSVGDETATLESENTADTSTGVAAGETWDHLAVGTLFHALAERWNLQGEPPSPANCAAWLQALGQTSDVVELGEWMSKALQRFTQTPLFIELVNAAQAGRLWHELTMDALYQLPGDTNARPLRITGRIDLLWQDANNEWHLLDYKVTKKGTSTADVQALKSAYGQQLAMYRAGLSTQGIHLRSARLYLVLSGGLIQAHFNP